MKKYTKEVSRISTQNIAQAISLGWPCKTILELDISDVSSNTSSSSSSSIAKDNITKVNEVTCRMYRSAMCSKPT